MKIKALCGVLVFIAAGAGLSFAEEQVRDQSGVVIEIRQESGGVSYAYDGNRNFNYLAIGMGQGVVDYRDKYGVHTGVGGPGTYQWAVSAPEQFGATGRLSNR